ncbi:Alpha/beta hydrolase family-domain-containing protein [Phlebopus sp. FC_14]|nr:Alpha/beta hydrolase family-domain-containing protein [Phlebopus sp. FC_14]
MAATRIPYTPTPAWTTIHPRSLLLIDQCPSVDTPPLPSPPRQDTFHPQFARSTHIIPAAFPRVVPDIPLPHVSDYSARDSERKSRTEALAREVIQRQATFTTGKLGGGYGTKVLWNCLNRYVRTSIAPVRDLAATGVTLLLAHANGFPKEIWETMLRSLLDSPGGTLVDEIWAFESVQHGDAALINANSLSGIFDWMDNARDIANFLLNYLPEQVSPVPLPTRLERLPQPTSNVRKEQGYHTRKVVVIAHSFGGCSAVRAALDFPKLFSSIILLDPVITQKETYQSDFVFGKVLGAFLRRQHWPSREEALRLLEKSPFFAAWHPDVLRLYVDHGLTNDPDNGGVKLKMPALHEGLVFANVRLPYETWELLEKLDEGITLRWIMPPEWFVNEEATRVTVWRRPTNASNVVLHSTGHLMVQEAPLQCAQDVSDFILRKYGRQFKTLL